MMKTNKETTFPLYNTYFSKDIEELTEGYLKRKDCSPSQATRDKLRRKRKKK